MKIPSVRHSVRPHTGGRENKPEDTKSQESKPQESKPQEHKSGETGGPKGPEPTRYGDWERNGRCVDF